MLFYPYKISVFYFAVGFPVLFFYLFGSPYQRGFFCNDESIRYPFKESTVSSSVLYTVGLGLPTITVSNASLIPTRYIIFIKLCVAFNCFDYIN